MTAQPTRLWGLIDTRADVTVISQTMWPKSWPQLWVPTTLSGMGGGTLPLQSKDPIIASNPDGIAATARPFILPTPWALWGRDCLSQRGFSVGSNLA